MGDSLGPIPVEINGEKVISYKSPAVEEKKSFNLGLWGGVGAVVLILWFVYTKKK